jgi:CRISPR-associated protein Cmr4
LRRPPTSESPKNKTYFTKLQIMKQRLLYLFTRTPLHVGAGSSVGAIDQPIQRERHTGFPVIPASSLKGTFADAWNDRLLDEQNDKGETKKVRVKKDGMASDAAWLFGSDSDKYAAAGALHFSEARLLAFPIRSAKGSFAWITCPLILQRAVRDAVLDESLVPSFPKPANGQPDRSDELAFFAANGPLALGEKIVIEDYTFTRTGNNEPSKVGEALKNLLVDDLVWQEIASRLVILSDGMMSFFAQNACEVAQHVKISDETGTSEAGALFNQENVPSETLFYSVVHFFPGRGEKFKDKKPDDAVTAFTAKLAGQAFQFGGDASTGLGCCTVQIERT